MRSNRFVILLILGALLTGGAGWYLTKQYIDDTVDGYKAKFDEGRELTTVVVALKDLKVGDVIEDGVVAARKIPREFAHLDAVTPNRVALIRGRELRFPVAKGKTILPGYVVKTKKDTFASMLEPGTRALSLSVNSLDTVTGFLRPGDYVDLLITFAEGDESDVGTVPLMQNIKILATGQDLGDGRLGGGRYGQITVAVPPKSASRLIHAQSLGEISFLLRSQGDHDTSFKETISRENIMGEKARSIVVSRRGLEVIRGGR